MTDIQKVRHLAQDVALFASEDIEVKDGVPTYQLKYFPLVPDSVIITDSDGDAVTTFSIDEEAGTVTFEPSEDSELYTFSYKHTLLTEDAISTYLELEGDNIKLAAALALDAIATSQALIQKKIKTLDLQTDGPALAMALMKRSEQLRKQSNEDDSTFDIAEQINNTFDVIEKVTKDIMRQS